MPVARKIRHPENTRGVIATVLEIWQWQVSSQFVVILETLCTPNFCPGGYRHSSGVSAGVSHSAGSAYHHQNIHCVKISGTTDSGNAVVMRGCDDLTEFNRTFSTWTCFTRAEYNFVMPGMGMVRSVEKCYCRGSSCNGVDILGASKLLLTLILSYFAVMFVKV